MVNLNHPWIILDRLADVILYNVDGCIVEIGLGSSTEVLSKYAIAFNRKHYACDKSSKVCGWVNSITKHDNMILFECSSFDFMSQFKDVPALVFIDGNHASSIVGIETVFFFGKMNIGGVIFLHDTCPWETTYNKKMSKGKEPDTYKIRKSLEKIPNAECYTWPYTAAGCGLTMVLKKDTDQPFYRK